MFTHLRSRGQRKSSSEAMIKHVAAACMFAVVQEDTGTSNRQLQKLLGISLHQIKTARQNASDMIENERLELSLDRKQRSDCVRDKLKPYVFNFLKDDEFTRLDTNQPLVDVVDPRTGEIVAEHTRIWHDVNKHQQRRSFLESTYYFDFQRDNDGATAVSKDIWGDVLAQIGIFVLF